MTIHSFICYTSFAYSRHLCEMDGWRPVKRICHRLHTPTLVSFRFGLMHDILHMDLTCSHTTTMSDIPTTPKLFGGPQEAFETILSQIIQTTPFIREAKVKPHLLTFLSHPIVKELIAGSDAPAQPNINNPPLWNYRKSRTPSSNCLRQLRP